MDFDNLKVNNTGKIKMSLIEYLSGKPRHMLYGGILDLEREVEEFNRSMRNKMSNIRAYSAGTIFCISLLSAIAGFVVKSLKEPPTQTHSTCEYLDQNNDGRYESMRTIRQYIAQSDTSSIDWADFASYPGGEMKYREWTKEELRGYFGTYNYPKVDEIKFRE